MPITAATRWLCQLSAAVSLAGLFPSWRLNWGDRVQWYVVFWLALLAILLFLIPPAGGTWALIIFGVAMYRLQDLVFAVMDDALGTTCRSLSFREPRERFDDSLARAPIAILLVNVVQVIIIFAIAFAYLNSQSGGRDIPNIGCQGQTAACHSASDWFSYLYVSWTTLFTLGSGDSIVGRGSEAFVMLEVVVSLVIVGTGLATFIARSLATHEPAQLGEAPRKVPCGRFRIPDACSRECQLLRRHRYTDTDDGSPALPSPLPPI